jgi:hypothetical protein
MKPRPTVRAWISLIVVGAVIGTLLLGIGGRIAMRVIALSAGAPPGWSVGGTGTVLLLGALSGVLGALIRLLSAWLVPGPRWAETAIFSLALALLTVRGLRPVQALPFALFAPLVIAYGVMLETLWRRRAGPPAEEGVAGDAASMPL